MLDLESPTPLTPPEENERDQDHSTAHGIVEPCEFEELLERAMQILRARRASVSS